MSKSDIGWLNKDKVAASLRTLRRRTNSPPPKQSPSQREEHANFVDLLGEEHPSPLGDSPDAPRGFLQDAAPEQDAPPEKGKQSGGVNPAAQRLPSAIMDAAVRTPTVDFSGQTPQRTPSASKTDTNVASSTSTPQEEHAESATTETTSVEPQGATAGNIADRFRDAFSVLRGEERPPQTGDTTSAHDEAPAAAPTPTRVDKDEDEDEDRFALPSRDFDLSLHTSSVSAAPQTTLRDTLDVTENLVFEDGEFQDEGGEFQNETGNNTPSVPPSDDADPQVSQEPEHAFVPQIHSKILRTVRWKSAPDPEASETLLAWLENLAVWIKENQLEDNEFFAAEGSGFSLLHTSVGERDIATAVAMRKSMSKLHHFHDGSPRHFTSFRHDDERYMNLIWAPSDAGGVITLGIVSQHVYPDAQLNTLQQKLVRGIAMLPFT